MGHFGFSYVGLIYLLLLFLPNIFWVRHLPEGYAYGQLAYKENKTLVLFERIGQACVTFTALVFVDYNLAPLSPWSLWLIASFVLMILYELCWVRYFKNGCTLKNMYSNFCGIPVPLASLPVMAFLLLGIYGKVIWLIVSAVILGIGHVGMHLVHRQALKDTPVL
ncbi:MAG: hypothetical protein RR292_01850 [Christensenellaceae bacterium]